MEFTEFKKKLSDHFQMMTQEATHLFTVNVDKNVLWNTYLDSFPAGTNKMFRERREHDCSCCRHFIKEIGNVVVLENNQMHTIWELDLGDTTYQPVCDALDAFVKVHAVSDIYLSTTKYVGTDYNYEDMDGKVHRWDHFYLTLPNKFIEQNSKLIGIIKGEFRDTRNVFKRSLDEITMDALDTIRELIDSNTLYRGAEWKKVLTDFRKYKKEYEGLTSVLEKELYTWENSVKVGIVIGRIRNHSIGTLLLNVSEGMDLNLAVKKYEDIVAGPNYKRPKEIFTKKMAEEMEKLVTELGYKDSLQRRFANLDDITVNNVLFSNRDVTRIGGMDIFAEMKKEAVVNPRKFSRVEEIAVKDFIDAVLPTAREVEAFVENKHERNFVSLIAPCNPGSKSMFKWENGLSWAYTGNITDSDLRENVKAAGGNVDGVLRFSIQWNEDGNDNCDLDAHCIEPGGNEIYYSNCRKPERSTLGGQLDTDIICPSGKVAVENIVWNNKTRMKPGKYIFFVRQYSGRVKKGFRAEIEFDGEVHAFNYKQPMRSGENVTVAEVILDVAGNFSINDKLIGNSKISSRNIWGINTNQFVPVSVICYSPNYFDEQEGIGHKHLFFMLKECMNPENPNGFYNEYLDNSLLKYKNAFAALGSKCHVTETADQLSGIGFSMTKRAELIVKVKGATERIMKIKF